MITKLYTYTKDMRAGKIIVSIFTGLMVTLVLISTLWLHPPDSLKGYAYNLFPTILFVLAYAYVANAWPTLKVCEDGLWVEFFWLEIFVEWGQVISIRRALGSRMFKTWVIKTRALTPFHRLYGLAYGLTVSPCFLIHSSLEDYQEVIRLINQKTTNGRANLI